MRRYLAFAGETYYPGGGWDDFIGTFDTVEEAKAIFNTPKYRECWWQIVDTTTLKDITDEA